LKIIIDTRWIRSLKIDGIANFTLNITRELLNSGSQYDWLLLVESDEIADYLVNYTGAEAKKFFYRVDCSVNSLKNFYLVPKIISELKADIFFSPCYPFFSPFVKIRHIGVVHDLIPLIFPEMFKDSTFKFKLFYCNRFFQQKSLNHLSTIITVSHSTKNDLVKYLGQKPERIKVIVEGSNLFNPDAEYNPQPTGINGEYFLFVGRHEKYKNIDTLIRVYHQLPENIKNKYSLLIIGKFAGTYSRDLMELVRQGGEEKRVKFIDSVMPEELPGYYKNAKILIHLSLYEGFGLTVAEAMNFGLPVIASDRSSIPEVVGDGGILVNPQDIGQVTEAIIKLIENAELYKKLSENGRQRAGQFTWQKSAQQLREIFQ
jgi:glycosyltransferase involved in cell wall biosynthesis